MATSSGVPATAGYVPSCSSVSAGSYSAQEAGGFDPLSYNGYYKVGVLPIALCLSCSNWWAAKGQLGQMRPPHTPSPLCLQSLWPSVLPGVVLGALAIVAFLFFLVWVSPCCGALD